jgi:hypothetical protein
MSQTRIKVGGLQTRAAFQAASFNDEKGTVEVTFTTGARGLRAPWFGERFYEELEVSEAACDLTRLNNGASVLNSHSASDVRDVIGVVERAWIVSGEGRALIRFSDREDVKAIRADVKSGVLRHISIGYQVGKYEKTETAADGIPVYRATKWTPAEVSIVPVAFDDRAVVRSSESDVYEVSVIQRSTEKNAMTPEEIAAAAAKRQTEINDAVAAARVRDSGIQKAAKLAGFDEKRTAELIASDKTVEQVRSEVLDVLAARSLETQETNHVRMTVTDDSADKFKRGAEAWILEKGGALDVVRKAEAKDEYQRRTSSLGLGKVESGAGEFRGASMADLAAHFLRSHGVNLKTFDKVKLFQAAYNYRSGYHTTSDFAVLFENVMYKALLAAYATQGDVWSEFCGTKEVQDFRPSNFFRTGSFGVLPPLNENGEFQNTAIPDGEKSTVSVTTYGDIIALGRQAVINDDMGALVDVAQQRGRDARTTIEDKVFTQLALNSNLGPTVNGTIFFSVTNANINATAAANTAASWDLDAQKMGNQTDISGNHKLNLVPQVLLLSREKRMEAQVLNTSSVKIGGSNGEPNPGAGMAPKIVSTTRLTGTRRYWFANPSSNPAIVVGFLAGQGSAPVLSSEEGFRVDGTQFKTRLDFGVSFFDPKCAVTNAGA